MWQKLMPEEAEAVLELIPWRWFDNRDPVDLILKANLLICRAAHHDEAAMLLLTRLQKASDTFREFEKWPPDL